MEMIRDKLLRLMQEINSVGASHLLLYVQLDFIEKMEIEAERDSVFKEALQKIEGLVDKALKNIESYGDQIEIKNTYSEAYIFSKLRSLLSISKIPEEEKKTPDYKVHFRGQEIYIELKSLNMIGGNSKYREIMEGALDSKIEAEDQIRKGSNIGVGSQEIQPYLSPNKDYDPRSVRMVAEALIDKINQNIKQGQYASGDTILLVDLSDQLSLISKPSQAIQNQYYDDMGNTCVSGELWNVAFGEVGQPIYKPAEFEGADNEDGELQKEGILVTHPYINGILFHVDGGFYAVAEIKEESMNVIKLLDYVSKRHSYKSKHNNGLQGTSALSRRCP